MKRLTMTLSPVSLRSGAVKMPSAKAATAALYRWALAPALAAAVLAGGYEAYHALEPPGSVIRHALARAGSEVALLPWSAPSERVQYAVSRHFLDYRATVDTAGFPSYVQVTLSDLDRDTCEDARRRAGRIEGHVVIEIESRGGTACHDRTAITWRIMP